MPLSTISLRRPLSSYAKYQHWFGNLIRNRDFQLRKARVVNASYLDIGCGPNTHPHFINLDYLWHPEVDVCWDVRRGLPFGAGSMKGVFSEHCLEHFDLGMVRFLLAEVRRVLARGGVFRVVVPDAELYLTTYVHQTHGGRERSFPYQKTEQESPLWTPLQSVNRVFYQDRASPYGHCTMFDFDLLRHLLQSERFAAVTRRSFGVGTDRELLIDTPSRKDESIYVEATVP